MMSIVVKAFVLLYPDKDVHAYSFTLTYSGRFSPYNGHVRYRGKHFDFSISALWKGVSEEIKIGLLQHLLQKALRTTIRTIHQDLYESFVRNVHIAIPKVAADPELRDAFDRVNEQYFLGMVEMPNLVWGQKSFRKLGSYEYAADKLTISQVFRHISLEYRHLLDYVMYHEMLHKVHKFKTVNGRSMHHTRAFRKAEAEFEGFHDIERQLRNFLRKKRVKGFFGID